LIVSTNHSGDFMTKRVLKAVFLGSLLSSVLVVATTFALTMVRQIIIEENEALVHAMAQGILPSLMVNDMEQVKSLIAGLETHSGVESAELISSQGASIASYTRSGYEGDPFFELASVGEDNASIHVMAPVTFDSVIVANLHLAINLWPTYIRIMTWLGVLLIVPSVLYVLIKHYRVKIRFEKIGRDDDDGQSGNYYDLKEAIDQAMADANVSLEFQPIQRMSDCGLYGIEAVVCWGHPSGQTLHMSPADFTHLAERAGICLPFEDWLLLSALSQAADWQQQYGPMILTLNISASQFTDSAFAHKVRMLCEQVQYPHQLLELELNESIIYRVYENSLALMGNFSAQGLSVTLDAFGLSPMSLDLLQKIPVNKIKIDRKLLKRMDNDEVIYQSIHTLIRHSVACDVQVMAEGVETPDQLTALQSMGCTLGQGRYFHNPMSAVAMSHCLASSLFDTQAKRAYKDSIASFDSGRENSLMC
jgi:EAL domain-containing protein (putative c-di-GMP-specific phosphodiesterase class I)